MSHTSGECNFICVWPNGTTKSIRLPFANKKKDDIVLFVN